MERTMTIKKFFAPSTTRLGRQQWFRDARQRLTMVLMLVMLTTVTAWAQETIMTVTAEDVTVTYDGSEHYITVNVSVPESGATITYCETKNGTYTDTNPTYTNAGVNTVYYKVTASGYADYSGSATVTINKATPVVTNPPTASAISYGQILDYSEVSGHPIDVNGDELSGTWAWVAPTTMPNVSDSGTTEYSVVFTPTDTGNYDSFTTTTTLTINKAALTITANNKSINYGDLPANNGVTYSGFVNGENENNLVGTLTYAYSYSQYGDVGNAYAITPSGLTSSNYEISFVDGTLTVIAKALTVTADDITIDHGAAAPAYTYSVTGLVNGESLTTEPTLSCDYAQGDAIGTYPISISGAAASANYTISYTPGTLTVQSKKYTVTFQNEDCTQLQSSEVEWGETPAYTGETPTKDATAQYTYTFAGWTPEIVAVTEDATYTATYSSTLRTNGYCGTDDPKTTDVDESVNVTWNYNTSTKTITISGGGPMMYYNSVQNGENWNNGAPWKAFAGEIEHVVISDGITYVGSNTFAHCPNISSVTLPTDQQLYEIGPGAFGNCTSLTSIDIPMSVNKINDGAFAGCSNLASVTLGYGDGAKFTIGKDVFPATTTIIVPLAALQSYLQASSWCAYADKIISTGYCGKDNTETTDVDESHNVIWTLAKNTGDQIQGNVPLTLTISKNPEVTAEGADFSMADGNPWRDCSLYITNTVIGSGVTSIGASAFMNCENMATVSIPTSVTSIGNNAFSNSGLTAITLNEGLQTIGDAAFFTKLTTINIPASVEAIGANPFGDVETITVDENSTHFKTDHDIALLTYDGTTLIQYAKGNTETTSYAVPDGVMRIGANAFSNSDHLTDVVIPASVESIGEYGFNSCSKLATIRVFRGAANGITTIGEDAFTMRSSDPAYSSRRIYVPKSALEVYCAANIWKDYASKIVAAPWGDALRGGFCGVDNQATTTIDESKNVAWALTANGDSPEGCDAGSGLTLTITKAAEGQTSYDMAGGWPFDDGAGGIDEVTTALSITQAVISDGVTNIGENAFMNCENMATVSIPSSVTSIGACAFEECKSLTSNITIPDGVRVINNSTFNGCAKLTTVVLPSGLTTIGASAFAGCDKLSSIGVAGSTTNEMPTSLTTIGKCAFQGSGLPAITLNEGLKTIGDGAFSPSKLTTINIPASVENIGEGAFTYNYLESISVADGNTHFITDGKTLIALIDDNNKTLLTYARANTETTSYAVPDGVTRIGAYAFSNSDHLTEVILPEGLKTIGDNAFYDCDAITDIAIPATVESIGTEGFESCDKLATIRVFRGGDAITTIGQNAFTLSSLDPASSSRRIYVPLSALNTYRTAVNWEKYYSGGAYWIFAGDETELFSSTATNTWMTWCSNKAYGKPVGCKAYTVSAVSGGEVTLTPVAGLLLPAYTPLLIKRDDTSAALTAIGGAAVTAPASGYNATTGLVTKTETGFSMLGAAKDAPVSGSITAGYSYALFDGEFLKIDDSTLSIPAHRCILTLPEPLSASRLSIVDGNGDTTGIISVHSSQSIVHSEADAWYTLDGRKLDKQPTVKGLYIHNGRKVVIK